MIEFDSKVDIVLDLNESSPDGVDAAALEKEGEEETHFSLIAKLLPADDGRRACVFEANLLEKEIEMYFEVLPALAASIRCVGSNKFRF